MLSDILFERVPSSEDPGFAQIRQRVETIMETLQTQKQLFESAYQRKLTQYEQQMKRKDSVIKELSKELQRARSSCERANRDAELYKNMIRDLRQEFYRMETAVAQVSQRKKEGLKRVKSDYIFRESQANQQPQVSTQASKMPHDNISTASKTIKKGIAKARQYKQSQFGPSTVTTSNETNIGFWARSNILKKENRIRIIDFKENLWQQTF